MVKLLLSYVIIQILSNNQICFQKVSVRKLIGKISVEMAKNCKILVILGLNTVYFFCEGSFYTYLHKEINFITHFFLKILQRNSKLVVLGNLGMPGHTHTHTHTHTWNNSINLRKHLTFIFRQKINFIHHSFPEIFYYKDIVNFYGGTLDMPGYTHPKWYCQFIENFHLQWTNQLYPPCFSQDCQQ